MFVEIMMINVCTDWVRGVMSQPMEVGKIYIIPYEKMQSSMKTWKLQPERNSHQYFWSWWTIYNIIAEADFAFPKCRNTEANMHICQEWAYLDLCFYFFFLLCKCSLTVLKITRIIYTCILFTVFLLSTTTKLDMCSVLLLLLAEWC